MAKNVCKLPVQMCCFTSPLGFINVSACSHGLHTMEMDGELSDDNFTPNEKVDVQIAGNNNEDIPEILKICHVWLQQYFKNVKNISDVPAPDICSFKKDKLEFRVQVWKTLAETVGPGEVITYGALASRLNKSGAARAVGSAMRNNPTGIIIPCHRVVRANDMGLYSGGRRQSVKCWLLRHEGVTKYSISET